MVTTDGMQTLTLYVPSSDDHVDSVTSIYERDTRSRSRRPSKAVGPAQNNYGPNNYDPRLLQRTGSQTFRPTTPTLDPASTLGHRKAFASAADGYNGDWNDIPPYGLNGIYNCMFSSQGNVDCRFATARYINTPSMTKSGRIR